MITLEQVRQLEARVKRAVDLIDRLRGENTVLKERLEKNEHRLRELEDLVEGFRTDQDQIEEGIRDILNQLNSLEDGIHGEGAQPANDKVPPAQETPTPREPLGEEHVTPERAPYEAPASDGSTGNTREEDSEEVQTGPEEVYEDDPAQLDIF